MKIAFLCSSLAPGRDGVGDYVRQLAAACTAAGHICRLVALHDRHLAPGERRTAPEETRFSASLPWTQRARALADLMAGFAPDWVSWQIVPYGFHTKGVLPAEMSQFVHAVGRWPQHVMLHELWIGLSQTERLRAILIGAWQRHRLLSFLDRAQPAEVHTSNAAYQTALARRGWQAEVLPLFGNIPVQSITRATAQASLHALTAGNLPAQPRCIGVLFGTIHPQWHADDTLDWLQTALTRSGSRLVLLSLGRAGAYGESLFARLANDSRVRAVRLGELSSTQVSHLMQAADFGLATHPRTLLGKSGSTIAMFEHGLPVLAPRDDWHLPGRRATPGPSDPLLASPAEMEPRDFLSWLSSRPAPAPRLPSVCAQFCGALGEPVLRTPALA